MHPLALSVPLNLLRRPSPGAILFGRNLTNTGIHRISAAGRTPMPVTTLEPESAGRSHTSPSLLPDGGHFLFSGPLQETEENGIYVASLDSGEKKLLTGV